MHQTRLIYESRRFESRNGQSQTSHFFEVYKKYKAARKGGNPIQRYWFGSEMRTAIKKNWGDAAARAFRASDGWWNNYQWR